MKYTLPLILIFSSSLAFSQSAVISTDRINNVNPPLQLDQSQGELPFTSSQLQPRLHRREINIDFNTNEVTQPENMTATFARDTETGLTIHNYKLNENSAHLLFEVDDLDGLESRHLNDYSEDFIQLVQSDQHLFPHSLEPIRNDCDRLLELTLANQNLMENEVSVSTTHGNIETNRNLNLISRTLHSLLHTGDITNLQFPGVSQLKNNALLRDKFIMQCSKHIESDLKMITPDIINDVHAVADDRIIKRGETENTEETTENLENTDENCKNSKDCFWKRKRNVSFSSCNMFACNINGSQFGTDQSFQDIATLLLLKGDNFEYQGDSNFCNTCFKEAASDKETFEAKKIALNKKIEDTAIIKAAQVDLYKLAEIYETIIDTNALNPSENFNLYNCNEEIESLKTYQCSEEPAEQANYTARLEGALSHFGMNLNSPANQIANIFMNKALKTGTKNNCTREDYSLFKQNTWMSQTNKKTRDAFEVIMDDLLNNSQAQSEIETYCSTEGQNRRTSSFLSEQISKSLGRELIEDKELVRLIEQSQTTEEAVQVLCNETNSTFIKNMICMKKDDPRFRFFDRKFDLEKIANTVTSANAVMANAGVGFGITVGSMGIPGVGPQMIQNENSKAQLISNSFTLLHHTLFYDLISATSKYNSNIKVNLEDKKSFCTKVQKAKENNLPLSESLRDKYEESVPELNKKLCQNAMEQIQMNLCGENKISNFSAEDIEKSLDSVREEYANDDDSKLAINSLQCKNNFTKYRQSKVNDNLFKNKTSLIREGVLATPDAQLYDHNPAFYEDPANPLYSRRNDFNTFLREDSRTCDELWRESMQENLNIAYGADLFETDVTPEKLEEINAKESTLNKFNNTQSQVANKFVKENIVNNIASLRKEFPNDSNLTAEKIFKETNNEKLSSKISDFNNSFKEQNKNKSSIIASDVKQSLKKAKEKDIALNKEIARKEELFEKDSVAFNKDSLAKGSNNLLEKNPNLLDNSNQIKNNENNRQLISNTENTGTQNTTQANRSIASLKETSSADQSCDEACLQRLRDRIIKKESSNSWDNQGEAITAGLKQDGLNQSIMDRFTDVMKGSDNSDQLRDIQSSYQSLIDKTAQIESLLEESPEEIQQIEVPKVNNPNYVFNPRNSSTPQFLSREEVPAETQSYVAPNFSSSDESERLSFIDYKEQRQNNSELSTSTQSINAQIDQSFVESSEYTILNDEYIGAYLDHVDKSNGSIEHLIVYENGQAAKIRIPDPENSGQYILRDIPAGLKTKIDSQLEEDLAESYALYSMINFEQSLADFISTVEAENENVVSLSGLNQVLNQSSN